MTKLQNILRISLISLLVFSAQAGHASLDKPCSKLIEQFFNRTLNEYKNDATAASKHIRTPRLVNPQEEMEIVKDWTNVKQPKIITAILPKDVHIINHSLNGANEEGVVKTNGGVMAHVRAYVRGIGSNFGVNFYALMDNLFHKNPSFVRSDAEAVVVFIHGGGTKTTGHHVAASLMNFLNPYKVDVVSLDLPWHGEGPRNSVENATDSINLVREYIEKYITPAGKPVFISGHSMGGVFSDVYRRLYPNDKLVKGIISLSTVADAAPGKTIEEKHAAEILINEFNKTNPNIPEDEIDLSNSLARQNKIAPLCGAFCSTFMNEVDWALPAHRGSNYVPGLYVIGEGDALYQGSQKSFKEFVGELNNTELVVFGKRKVFGKVKNKVEILDGSLSRDVVKRIQAGTYYGDIDQKKVNKLSLQERFELRNSELLRLKSQGQINFDSSISLPELFENDPQNIGHLIFDHKPLVTFSANIPDEVRKRIVAANYYGDVGPEQIRKMTEEQKMQLRSSTLLKLRNEGKISWDPRYSADDLNQIETFVLMRQFIEKNIGKELKSSRAGDLKAIYNVTQAYINNLVFREFADKYIYSHLRASEIIAQLGPERGILTGELNALNKLADKTEAQVSRIKEIQTRLHKITGIIERKFAENPKDQLKLDDLLRESDEINLKVSLMNKERTELRSNNENGLYALRSELSALEKQIVNLGETLNTPALHLAKEKREKNFEKLIKQDAVVRVSLDHFLTANKVNGKYLPDLFKKIPVNVRNEFEKYEKLSNLYQSSVKDFSTVLNREIHTASDESHEIAKQYEEVSQKLNSTLVQIENIDKEMAKMATMLFKLETKRNQLVGGAHFKLEHYNVWNILNSDPQYIRDNYTEVNSILMNIWKDWQSLWGNRVAESSDSLY